MCISEDFKYPSPFNTMKKFLTSAVSQFDFKLTQFQQIKFKYNYYVTVLFDLSRDVFVLMNDGKHRKMKIAVSVTLNKLSPTETNNVHVAQNEYE